ncbi:MAG: sugar phosphate isomerase/epimerase family protein [Saprospiraceae bacterium]
MKKTRRKFIKKSGQTALGFGLLGFVACEDNSTKKVVKEPTKEKVKEMFFKISLAQWSLHKSLGRNTEIPATMDNLDFAAKAKSFGIDGLEYVNQFFKDKAKDTAYLNEMIKRADDNGCKNLLIMIDGEGSLGDLDEKKRMKAVENHYKWVDAAKHLGCHSIRVNAAGEGTAEEVGAAAVLGLGKLAEYGKSAGLNVIVENHGGYSSDGSWLSGVMKQINMDNCGTLPDFGNFCLERGEGWKCVKEYDRYKGMEELMPFAKAVSAKSNVFDDIGNEKNIDFLRIMKTVKNHGYKGYVGIEYEGDELSEDEGIIATKKLLEKVGAML